MQKVAAWASERGVALLTEDALIQRLPATGPFPQTLVQRLLAQVAGAPSWHGRVLRVCDSTSLSEQASRGTDWRVHGIYDLGGGRFTHLEVTDSHGGEALDRGQPVAGEIRIADRGYANAQGWRRFVKAGDAPSDFIVRMRWNTTTLLDQAGRCFDLIAWLQTRPRESEMHEITAWAQTGKRQRPIGIRLIARSKSPEAIEAEHKRLRQRASRKQTQLDPRSLIAAEYLILATSLLEGDSPATDILAAYSLRWQIELAFKKLKSLLHIDKIRTRTDAGTRCWLYAHLLVALLESDFSQDILDSFP